MATLPKPLSKNMGVINALIESCLQRNPATYNLEEVKLALKMMRVMIPHRKLYIIADSDRFAIDFAEVMDRPFQLLNRPEHFMGLSDAHVIILYTGHRTDAQQKIHNTTLASLKDRVNVVKWYIGEWH